MAKIHRVIVILTGILMAAFLSGCIAAGLPNDAASDPSEAMSGAGGSPTQDIAAANGHIDEFLENFAQRYPDFELLDYITGSDENSPIELAAIAKDKQTGSSSTLFIVDANGFGQVVLASDRLAVYREADGLTLKENKILLSLDTQLADGDCEIHDFELTVTQEEEQGIAKTLYSSKETIRAK